MVNVLQQYPRPDELWRRSPRADGMPRISAPNGIDARINTIHGLWKSTKDLRDDITATLAFADGDQIIATPGMPNESSKHQAHKPRFAANLLGYILARFSYLYAEPPIRTSESAGEWERILWRYGVGLDALMDYAQPSTRLLGTTLGYVLPAWGANEPREALRMPSAGLDKPEGLDFFVVTPDMWTPLVHREDPRFIAAVLIDVGTATKVANDGREHTAQILHYWDDEWFVAIIDGKVEQRQRHGLGAPPVFPIKGTLSPGTIWGHPLGGVDLVTCCRSINSVTEELLHTARLQRGQPVVVGEPKNLQLGPDAPLEVESQGDFTFVPNGANITGIIDAIKLALDRLAQSLGLPRSTFRVTDSPSGGVAVADRIELAEDRRRQVLVWRRNEQLLHHVAAKVWREWAGVSLSSLTNITYPERPAMLTHAERLSEVQLQLNEGLISRRDAVSRLDPGRTPTELDAMLAEADADIPARMRWRAVIAGHAEDVPGTPPGEDDGSDADTE